MPLIYTSEFIKVLNKAGLLPDECTLIDIVIGVDAPIKIKYERNLTEREVENLGYALANAVPIR